MPDIEEHIKKAIGEGAFNDLPGKGKPLNLDENHHADPDWRLAHHVLHSSGYTLPWIALRQEIERELEAARQALRRAWEWRQETLSQSPPEEGNLAAKIGAAAKEIPAANDTSAAEWQRAQTVFAEKIAMINKQINDYNMQTPSEKFQMMKLKPAREVGEITKTV